MKKICGKCNNVLSFDMFSKDKTKKYGLSGWCKECVKQYQLSDTILEIKRKAQLKYAHTEKGIKTERRHSKKRWDRAKADGRAKVYGNSKLEILREYKKPCTVCGSSVMVHAHHEDYSKPLEVVWLCPLHHSQRHKELRCQKKSMELVRTTTDALMYS